MSELESHPFPVALGDAHSPSHIMIAIQWETLSQRTRRSCAQIPNAQELWGNKRWLLWAVKFCGNLLHSNKYLTQWLNQKSVDLLAPFQTLQSIDLFVHLYPRTHSHDFCSFPIRYCQCSNCVILSRSCFTYSRLFVSHIDFRTILPISKISK